MLQKHVKSGQTKIDWIVASAGIIAITTLLLSPFKAFSVAPGDCDTGYVSKDENSPFSYSGSETITRVIVKAGSAQSTDGNQCTIFTTNSDNGCYSVTGLGTSNVSVTKTGSGKDCKDISHVEFYSAGQVSPTPTQTPTSTPTNTPTPTKRPTSTPTVTPTATNTPTPTPTDDECNGACGNTGGGPTNTPTATPTPTATNTPAPTATPTSGSTNNPTATPTNSPIGGQVLGATTLAQTGNASDALFISYLGIMLILVGAYDWAKTQK
jgi:hypothetical protein